jgi:hypothetical protein
MSIKRYTISGLHPHIIESKDGFMVYYEDYARLKAFSDEAQAHISKQETKRCEMTDSEDTENARLNAEVERLEKAIMDSVEMRQRLREIEEGKQS